MKVILSSRYLANKLKELLIDEYERVYKVDILPDTLILHTDTRSEILSYVGTTGTGSIKQEDRRWDWVRDLVDGVDEQPIVLDINEHSISVIFQY